VEGDEGKSMTREELLELIAAAQDAPSGLAEARRRASLGALHSAVMSIRSLFVSPTNRGSSEEVEPEMEVRFVQSTSRRTRSASRRWPRSRANAVYAAIDVQVPVIPLTPERVWRALKGRA
jgi:hypothetical protein